VRRALRNNGLSIVLMLLFLGSIVPMSLVGQREYNADQKSHSQPEETYFEYLGTGHFVESVFENWESEFLQMFAFVLLTVWLRQKGSPESKKLEGDEPEDADPRTEPDKSKAPWPVRNARGPLLWLYEHSLSLVLLLLFLVSFYLHALGGAEEYSSEQQQHGEKPVTTGQYLTTARFWFESFQNWQSEFMAVGTLVVLSIFLRERGSPESKPVAHPHAETGTE
jgi:hypothetical protein